MSELLYVILYHCHQRHCGPEFCDPSQTGRHPAQHQLGVVTVPVVGLDGPLQKNIII